MRQIGRNPNDDESAESPFEWETLGMGVILIWGVHNEGPYKFGNPSSCVTRCCSRTVSPGYLQRCLEARVAPQDFPHNLQATGLQNNWRQAESPHPESQSWCFGGLDLRDAFPLLASKELGRSNPHFANPNHQPRVQSLRWKLPGRPCKWPRAMGQNPNRTPSEQPNPTPKIGSQMGGEFAYPQMRSHWF